MNSAVVLWPNKAPIMSIDLNVVGADGKQLLHKNMARDPKEVCSKTLERMRMLLGEGKKEKGKKMTREEIIASLPQASLIGESGNVLDLTKTNADTWKDAAILKLGEYSLTVSYNVPTVTSITPPPTLTVGAPAVCGSISIMFCSEDDLVVEWRCEGIGVVSRERVFFPKEEHVGRGMAFRCRPRDPRSMWTEVLLTPVQKPAATALHMPRWEHTRTRADVSDPNAFRVVTYNILYDKFCTSNFAKSQIYPFAKDEILDINYRKGVIASEIKAYNADVVFLQECGEDIYNNYYVHALRAMGFTSKYFNKIGLTKEGSAIAFNNKRFDVIDGEACPLTYPTLREFHPSLADELDKHPHAKEGLERMTAVGSLAVLKDKVSPERYLIVACTHLFYHPHGCHIRSLQAFMLAEAMKRLAEKQVSLGRQNVHLLLGGDFNFTRPTGAYELLTKGSITSTRDCWDKGFKFWWGCHHGLGCGEEGDSEISEIDTSAEAQDKSPASVESNTRLPPTEVFRSDLSLGELVFEDTHINEPTLKHTNFTMTFREIIDHIFIGRLKDRKIEEQLKLVRTIPLPSDEELSKDVAIPNATYPSDHVALVADLTFSK